MQRRDLPRLRSDVRSHDPTCSKGCMYRSHYLDRLGFPLCPPFFQSSMKRKQCDDSQLQALRLKASEIIASAHESNGEGKAKYKKARHASPALCP